MPGYLEDELEVSQSVLEDAVAQVGEEGVEDFDAVGGGFRAHQGGFEVFEVLEEYIRVESRGCHDESAFLLGVPLDVVAEDCKNYHGRLPQLVGFVQDERFERVQEVGPVVEHLVEEFVLGQVHDLCVLAVDSELGPCDVPDHSPVQTRFGQLLGVTDSVHLGLCEPPTAQR